MLDVIDRSDFNLDKCEYQGVGGFLKTLTQVFTLYVQPYINTYTVH